jgi:hypothetical protein
VKLSEIIRELDSFGAEETIYASEPWTGDSTAVVAREPESGVPADAERLNLKYFLEIFIAREFLDGWIANLGGEPTLQEKSERLIHYAKTDA